MKSHTTPFFRSVGTMIGSIVGVGVFGIPFAFAQSGPALGALILVGLASLLTLMQLMYAEVALHTPGSHRLAGYVKAHLGQNWGRFAAIALSLGLWGSMVAYMIVGGSFLHAIFSSSVGGSSFWYALFLAGVACVFIYRGIQFIARLETIIVGILLFLFAFIMFDALPHVTFSNLAGVEWKNALIPYGVSLFALGGMGVIPEMKAVLGQKHENQLPRAVITSMACITTLYLLFGFIIVAALGTHTTEIAFDGLVVLLGDTFRVVGAILGSVTVLSIFTLVGIELTNTFRYDLQFSKRIAVASAVGVPVVLYIIGVRQLVDVLTFVGSIFGGMLGILVICMYEKMRKRLPNQRHFCLNIPASVRVGIACVFASGILLTIFL